MSKWLLKAAMASLPPEWYLHPNACYPVALKDVLPTTLKGSVIYEYSCHCDSRYVGQTSQRLRDRIKQHVSK